MYQSKLNRFLFLVIMALVFISCNKTKHACSFYHWEQSLSLTSEENQLLRDLNVSELYVRVFDIDYKDKSKGPVFLSILNIKKKIPENIGLIPCIFITNRSFKNIDFTMVDSLAFRTATRVKSLAVAQNISFGDEIQIDCDWTTTTQRYYFAYLKNLKQYLPQFDKISATIRLHQFKYPHRTGVPPVDKGSLMVYNMGDFGDSNATNAIYTLDILKQYLNVKSSYPLRLDIAMPTFSWALVFRFGKAVKIIHHPNLKELNLSTSQFTKLSNNKFKVNKNIYYQGLYLYQGDILRVDKIDAREIEKGLKLIFTNPWISSDKVIYYHLFDNIKQLYTDEDFKNFNAAIG